MPHPALRWGDNLPVSDYQGISRNFKSQRDFEVEKQTRDGERRSVKVEMGKCCESIEGQRDTKHYLALYM